ncbi:sperm-associated antigen 16 protein-like [Osmerus mordax]|uniref:sperm-associated antigen 16 protein-like n=1 Tax=Osmerus mordax TaxID=8014 RepID=UPI0035108161
MTTDPCQQPETDSYFIESLTIPADSDDGFQYDEVTFEEHCSLTEGEEDLEATVRAIQERSDDTTSVALNLDASQPRVSHVPEVLDDFLRNFLVKMGMKKTLDCFQTEWTELAHKGLWNTNQIELVPEVYTQNQLLDSQLKNAQRERDEYKHAALAAADTLVKLQKARDFHRLQHKRVMQEKTRLIEDIRKLKTHCSSYEPVLRQMNEKYQVALKEKMLASLERDRALGQAHSLEASLHNTQLVSTTEGRGEDLSQEANSKPDVKLGRETKPQMVKVGRSDPSKDLTKNPNMSKNIKDSEFPVNMRVNPCLAHMKDLSISAQDSVKANSFHLTNTFKAHSLAVSCLALHPCKQVLACGGDDLVWRLWGLPEGELIATGEGHSDWLSGISFHPDGSRLATTSGDTSVRVWDLAQGHCVLILEGHTGATWGCTFHSCGDFVASCSLDYTVKVWDLQSERCRYTLRGHTGSVNSVEFLPFSNTLLTSSADRTLSLWDARTGLCALSLYGHRSSCNHATFTAAGDIVASCDALGSVMLWDVRNPAAPTVTVETGPLPSNQVAFSPSDQTLVVAGDDGDVRLMDLAVSQVARVLKHEDAVQSVIFDHKGEYLLSGVSDGQIYVWS